MHDFLSHNDMLHGGRDAADLPPIPVRWRGLSRGEWGVAGEEVQKEKCSPLRFRQTKLGISRMRRGSGARDNSIGSASDPLLRFHTSLHQTTTRPRTKWPINGCYKRQSEQTSSSSVRLVAIYESCGD